MSRILVVEDEELVALDLQQTLSELHYNVAAITASGKQAIDLTSEIRPDLVLMDISLNGLIDGVEAACEIRDRYRVPVVFLTANTDPETVARANGAAPYGYLVKPWRSNELDATIRVALHQHQLLEEMFAGQAWLTTIMGSISDGIIATDAQATVRYLNGAAELLLGVPAPEALGMPIERIFRLHTLAGQPLEVCQLRRALLAKAPIAKDRFVMLTKGDAVISIEDSAAPITDRGAVVGAVSVFRDITSVLRKEREQEQERDRLEEEVQVTTEALGQTRSELRALSAHFMNAQEDERRRLARDLHDDFGQRAALIDLNLGRLAALVPGNTEAAHTLELVHKQVTTLSEGLREMSHTLHPAILSDLGLVPGLRSLAEDFQSAGLDIRFRADGFSADVSIDISTALFRITQEALRNAAKHAASSPVRVALSESDGSIQLSIEDGGPGFCLTDRRTNGGMGLLSMHERARNVGGSMLLRTAVGETTRILVKVPVARSDQENR